MKTLYMLDPWVTVLGITITSHGIMNRYSHRFRVLPQYQSPGGGASPLALGRCHIIPFS